MYNPCPTFATSLPENCKINECDSDDDYDIRDHLDTVPIPTPEPLSWKDYMYTPSHCNVIYSAPQESDSPQIEQLMTSFSTSTIENSPSNVHKIMVDNSAPPIPPSFSTSNTSLQFSTSKLLVDKLIQENKELKQQLQKENFQNTQRMTKIMELTEQVQTVTEQNHLIGSILHNQSPVYVPKYDAIIQTNVASEITVDEIVQKDCVSLDTQTLPVTTVDFSSQANSCCKESITSEFQCQVSLGKLPHMTQETQTQPVRSGDFCSQTHIPNNPKTTAVSQNSFFEFENQQLKETLSQLQSEYNSLQEFHENLNEKYQKALEYCADANIQVEDQTKEIAQLKDQLVALQENCDKLQEHENLVCNKYNSTIPEFNSLVSQLENANNKISDLQKTVKDLQRDNYLLNNVLEKICSDSSSKTTCTGSGGQANVTQTNTCSHTPTHKRSSRTSSSPTKSVKSTPSRKTSPQPNIPISQIKITTNFKRFRCAWCSEEKHPWDKCNQWNKWNLGQKQQALQILDNAKRGKLPSPVSKRPHFHSQQKLPLNPPQVKRNRGSFSKVQWEKQAKINENVKDAGLVKISSSFYVPQCSVVRRGVESSSLRRSRTTPNAK